MKVLMVSGPTNRKTRHDTYMILFAEPAGKTIDLTRLQNAIAANLPEVVTGMVIVSNPPIAHLLA